MVVRHDLCLIVISYVMCLAHITFASAFLLRCTYEPCVISCCIPLTYLDAGCLDLVDISMTNPFVLIVTCLLKPSHLKTSTLFILEVIVINHQKGRD